MVLKGFVKSREQASSILMTGNVFVDNKRVEKPGLLVSQNSKIEIKYDPFISHSLLLGF